MPYITASIVVQLGATLYGPWQALRKEGETGRKKLNQYTRYLTVMITLVQGYLAVRGLEFQSVKQGIEAVVQPGILFELAGTVSLVGGTLFLMWIGEQITSRGIGNGVSLIIMAGIIARLPQGSGSYSRAAGPARSAVSSWSASSSLASCWCCSSASWSGRSGAS